MTGPENSIACTRIEKVNGGLKQYTDSILVKPSLPTEVDQYLNLNKAQLDTMSAEDCGVGSYILQRYSYYLQSEINIQQRTVNWCHSNIKLLVSPVLGNYYGSYEVREASAIDENPEAKELAKIQREAQLKMDSISFLATKISYMADSLSKLQETKRRRT